MNHEEEGGIEIMNKEDVETIIMGEVGEITRDLTIGEKEKATEEGTMVAKVGVISIIMLKWAKIQKIEKKILGSVTKRIFIQLKERVDLCKEEDTGEAIEVMGREITKEHQTRKEVVIITEEEEKVNKNKGKYNK